MATESAMRMVESGGSRNWPPLKNMAAEELGSLLNGHSFGNDHSDIIPNRSGSAPPSMEGSFAAIADLLAKQNSGLESSMDSLRDALENCESEEELRSDPSYIAYYCSNVNLNPRLPPPLISRENRRLVRHIGASGNNWKSSSLYGRSSLSTHKEEPEDERSAGEDIFNTASAVARHKSLVDLIQEDFPRTPSPVFSMSRPSEPSDQDVNAISLDFSSVNISNVAESNSSSDICVNTSGQDPADDNKLKCNNNHLVKAVSSSQCHDTPQIEDPLPINAGLVDEARVSGMPKPDLSRTESRMNKKQDENHFQGRIMLQQYPSAQQGTPYHINSGVNNMSHGHAKFSSYEMRPSLQSPGLTSPLYTTAAAYMPSGNPFYPNYQPSGVYPPQYNAGGYALNSALPPPLMGGYPSHGPMPLQFDATSVSTGANIRQSGNSQHQKFYGQQGLMLQPHSYLDPLHMQYLPPFGNVYGASARLASTGVTGPPQLDPSMQNDLLAAAYMGDQKLHSPTNGGLGVYDPRKLGVTVGSYYGGVPGMGLMPQFPSSPISSPLFPSSPIGGVSHFSRPNETRLPQVSNRNAQRGVGIFDDRKRHSFLEELKSSNAQKFELSDMAGRIVEFSVDQHGSRFIQQKLEHCSAGDKVAVFKEVLPHASKLMTDVFGNYVIQKFFEYGSPEQRKELADKLAGQMLPLSLQMYGCRVIQKALEVIELDQKSELVLELDGHVMKCVRDQNGNHVIQKCIECVPVEKIQFIISAFRGQVATLSTHTYGCRVIQRILEHCSDGPQSQCIVDEILESAYVLAQDQYGNYVTQHVLERGKPHERTQIISQLTGKVVQLSQHKYASNVVEKCLEYGDAAERELLIQEIIGQSGDNDNLLTMMKDQFANYVVQKTLERCSDEQREELINRISVHCNALKKYTYGKHIVARFEQLYGESQEPESYPQA